MTESAHIDTMLNPLLGTTLYDDPPQPQGALLAPARRRDLHRSFAVDDLPRRVCAAPQVVSLMGLPVNAVSEQETIEHILSSVAERRGGWVCPANLDVLRQWCLSPELRDLVAPADLVVADGMPLLWAARAQGSPLPERVAGSTLVVSLTAAAAEAGASVFLLGGNPGTADVAADRLRELAPGLDVAGILCPPVGFESDPVWMAQIEQSLRAARPDIVYVALGFPKQERLIAAVRDVLPAAWFISVGVSLSFVAGEITRAPRVMQRCGLEWLHRIVQEPRRLFRRYLVQGMPFLFTLMTTSRASRTTSQAIVP